MRPAQSTYSRFVLKFIGVHTNEQSVFGRRSTDESNSSNVQVKKSEVFNKPSGDFTKRRLLERPITKSKKWAEDAIDQRIIKTDAQIKALLEANEITRIEKADNLVLDSDTKELYLTAEGEQIGDKVKLSDLGNEIVQSSDEGLITMMI
mgnify:CR=1 FL=1